MHQLTIALDWTPNTNHTGFFVAQALGYYSANGLAVEILSPADDHYATTPAKKVETGRADFAVAPFESVISLNTKAARVNAVAVAALLQEDLSSIAALAASRITRPRELDGRRYASYQARYEDAIVRQMVINDGGTGDLTISYPAKLGIWETLLGHAADATWIFDNWEGIAAETSNLPLTRFRLADYAIPYAYSPVIFSTRENIAKHPDAYRAFLQATKQGYQFAIQHPQQAVALLAPQVPEADLRQVDLARSQALTARFYGEGAVWGVMDEHRIARFLAWLVQHKLEGAAVTKLALHTNELLR